MDSKKITKEMVVARLIRGGVNEEEAREQTRKHFDYALPIYKHVKAICEVVMTLP